MPSFRSRIPKPIQNESIKHLNRRPGQYPSRIRDPQVGGAFQHWLSFCVCRRWSAADDPGVLCADFLSIFIYECRRAPAWADRCLGGEAPDFLDYFKESANPGRFVLALG